MFDKQRYNYKKWKLTATKGSMWVTRRAHNPNLQVTITHARHVCSQFHLDSL